MKSLLSNRLRILFATFSPYKHHEREATNGNIEPMLSFFVPRVAAFTLIDQPHTGSSEIIPHVEEYAKGKLRKKYMLSSWFLSPLYSILERLRMTDNDTSVLFKIRDFLSCVLVGGRLQVSYDYFIGFESVNTIAGILLRSLHRVKHVVYYVSDYSPKRYANRWINSLYVWLDRFCCYHADFIWDVSRAMQPARYAAGLNPLKSAPVIHVPNAVEDRYIHHLPCDARIPYSLVFMGTLGYENGPDVAVEALPVISQKFPHVRLHIIGKGERELDRLRALAHRLRVERLVTFHGFIKKNEDMFASLRTYALALAPYRQTRDSVRSYGDSLKLRAYAAAGLPVITTSVPPLGRELAALDAGVITGDNGGDFARVIMDFFAHPGQYQRYCANVILFAKHNTWDVTFRQAFEQMAKT